MKNFFSIHTEHHGLVSDKWKLYLNKYDSLLNPYREQEISLLEIGVQNGGSLAIWAKFFPQALKITGCDINPECNKLEYEDNRVSIIIGDANDDDVFKQVVSEIKTPSIVIDDGSHTSSDIIKSFVKYFSILDTDGVYIAEDLHCSYWSEYEGGLFHPYSSMAFFKALADVLNFEFWGINSQPSMVLQGFFDAYSVELSTEVLLKIHSVEFINSMCIIHKKDADQNVLGKRMVVGENDPVQAGGLELDGLQMGHINQTQNQWQTTLIKRIEKAEHEITARDVKISSLSEKLLDHEASINDLKNKLTLREHEISGIRNSHSWKITAPFRIFSTLIRRIYDFCRFKK